LAHLIPVPLLVVSAVLTVRAELRQQQRLVYVLKPLTTLLIILVAALSFLSPAANAGFTIGVLVGLAFSLGGDMALMLESERAFLIGVILFLLAHAVYALGFTLPNGFHLPDLVTGALLLTLGSIIYAYLRPGLGKMRLPVLAYVLIVCLMVNRALSAFFGVAFTPAQAWLLAGGATLFWLSDVILAVNRFRRPLAWHRLSLLPYFGGQLLIALSPSYFA
jgi:uncharacterized membrane protein YhhN